MTVRHPASRLPILSFALLVGIVPAAAQDVFVDRPPPFGPPPYALAYRRPVSPPPYAVPVGPPLITGYLPRNNAVPMYNEPPGPPAPRYMWR